MPPFLSPARPCAGTTWQQQARLGHLANAIAEYVDEKEYVSFVEIVRDFSPFYQMRGPKTLYSSDNNVVLWQGLSTTAHDALVEAILTERIYLAPAPWLSVLPSVNAPNLPIASFDHDQQSYPTLHWLPVVLVPLPADVMEKRALALC